MGLILMVTLSGLAVATPTAPDVPSSGANIRLAGYGPLPAAPIPFSALNTTLTINGSSVNLSSLFFGTTVNNEVRPFRGESDALNATPSHVIVWPGAMAGEDYDPIAGIHYNTYNGTPTHALTSEAQFVQLCRAVHCTAVVQVPAEIDDPSFAEEIVNFTEVNLSFTPAYWMIGNEPELWSHWKVPWSKWGTTYATGPTPTQFGNEVVAYVKAIRQVDNTTPILGLPASGCTCGLYTFDQWIAGVLKVTGSLIQAVAFHEYPAGWLGTGNGSLQAFYGTIQSAASIPVRMVAARAAVHSACPGCNVSVFISELGAALSWSTYGPYAIGFSGALSIASQITQGMAANVTNIDLFATELATTNSWFDPTGNARPDYSLYTEILDHLGPQAFSVNTTGLGHTVYAIDTIAPNDGGRRDLMVVNDNISHAVTFSPEFAEDPGGASVEVWSWNGSIHTTRANNTQWVEPYTANPVPQPYADGLPGTYTLPPQSLVVFEEYPAGGTFVQVNETGVPSPTRWYASVGSRFYETTASNLSLLLPSGPYPISSVGIPLPIGGKELTPSEQLGPFVPSPLQVSGRFTNTTMDFVDQWAVNLTASPAAGGTVSPAPAWWNSSQPLNLTATPSVGYAFVGWSGWGPGSANGTSRWITVAPTGRVVEKARFVVGNRVDLFEQGLPAGTPWTVTVRGFSATSTTNPITFYETPGAYGFTVSPVMGYRILPQNGGFTVSGPYTAVTVKFVPLTPPPPAFPVTFLFSGLPPSTAVSLTVRGVTQTTLGGVLDFALLNGSYAYQVGYVDGYHPDVSNKTFDVRGLPLTVDVPFVATVYPVIWEASGVRAGINWTVWVDGQPTVATSAWVTVWLANGSHPYLIELSANFSASPRTGVLDVYGSGWVLYPQFDLVEFPAEFDAAGTGAPADWSVRLGNVTQSAVGGRSAFLAANGTYTFDVHPPPGYYAVPSHGILAVAGSPAPTPIQFFPSSEKPSAALVAALSMGALSVSLWIGGAAVVGFAVTRRWRRPGGRGR